MSYPAGFWVGAGIPAGPRVNTFTECGCCGGYHRTDFTGDCREDAERFAELPDGAIDVSDDEAPADHGSTVRCERCGCDLHDGRCPEGCQQ